MKINYLEYKHSYSHALKPKLKQINYVANVLKNLDYAKNIIKKELKTNPEVIWTDKEQQFFEDIKSATNTTELYYRVKNAINKSETVLVEVDTNGELIK